MENNEMKKWIHIVIKVLLAAIIFSPMTFKLTNSITQKMNFTIAETNGAPNYIGLLIHAIVLAILYRLVYLIKF